MTDIRIDRPEETKTQTKKYYKSKYFFFQKTWKKK